MLRCVLLILIVLVSPLLVNCNDFFFGGRGSPPRGFNQASQDDSLYKILGVDSQSSSTDIKKAYRRKAMHLHPDKGGDEEEFKRLNEAYEILSDESSRSNYDRGLMGNDGGRGAASAADLAREMFRGFGGVGRGFGAFSMPIVFQLDLSLEDLFNGRNLAIPIDNTDVQVNIKPGMMSGQELILRGQFADSRGAERDIIFRIKETRHPTFQRKNADLLIDTTISLADSILGFEKIITHLDGKSIVVCSKKGDCVGTGDLLMIPDQGMPVYQARGRGRLFVRIKVDVPKQLWCSKEEARELERLFALSGQSRSLGDDTDTDAANESRTVHPAWGEEISPTIEKKVRKKKTKKTQAKDASPHPRFAGSKVSDSSSFGRFGQLEEEDDDAGNPFAQFFFR